MGYEKDTLILHDPSPRAGKTFSNEHVTVTEIKKGKLVGNKTGLPRSAKGFFILGKGMHVKSTVDFGIIDGAVLFSLNDPSETIKKPTQLEANPGDTEVSLDWASNSESNLAGYKVYSAEFKGGPYSEITSLNESEYIDQNLVNGTTYYYVVTAVDDLEQESEYSKEVSVTPSGQQPEEIASDGFESKKFKGGKGWLTPWRKKGDVALLKKNPHEGKHYTRLRKKTGHLKRPIDFSNVTGAHLLFWSWIKSFEAGDTARVQVSTDGKNYTTLMTFTEKNSDNTWQSFDIDLSAYDNTKRLRIVFDAQMDAANDMWFIDDIRIMSKP